MATTQQTQVKLSGVHLCCDGCTAAVYDAAENVPGVSAQCDKRKGTAVLTGDDPESIQKVLDGIAANGLYGESDHASLAIKDDPNIPQGRVKRATISGIHNCCGPCYHQIQKALRHTEGVTDDDGRSGATRINVSGDFSPQELIQSLHKFGFNARVTV